MVNVSIEEMKDCLEAYYESAGFSNFAEKELKGKSDAEITKMYEEINIDTTQSSTGKLEVSELF